MSIREVAALSLLGVAIPMSLAAQGRTPADYMATIEGVQGWCGMAHMIIRKSIQMARTSRPN